MTGSNLRNLSGERGKGEHCSPVPPFQLFPSRAGKVTGVCYTSLSLSSTRKVPDSDPSWQLGPTTSKHTPQIHMITPNVGTGGKHKANTLLGRYISQQGHTGRENPANAGAGPTHICSRTHHVRPRHPILTHLNDSGKTGTGHILDEAELQLLQATPHTGKRPSRGWGWAGEPTRLQGWRQREAGWQSRSELLFTTQSLSVVIATRPPNRETDITASRGGRGGGG